MCNLYTKFVKFPEICKRFSNDLVTENVNILLPGPVPRFSDLEVVALSMATETEGIDSENWLFQSKLEECRSLIPNLISRRQFNDRRKAVCGLQERIRSRMAKETDGGEDYFCIDSKPIEVCRTARWDAMEISGKLPISDTMRPKAVISMVTNFTHSAG